MSNPNNPLCPDRCDFCTRRGLDLSHLQPGLTMGAPAEGDPLAEMRAYVADAGEVANNPGWESKSKYRAGRFEGAQAMLAIAERTVGPALDALRALVEADQKTDAQALGKAWAEARRRV